LAGGAWFAGRALASQAAATRLAREHTQLIEERTQMLATAAVADERLRIARELHDVVAHAMSVIAVQAGTGRFVIRESPDVAAGALAAIETTSRDALQEMRRLLAVLRDGEPDGELLPAPGLADLSELVAASAAAGVDVEVVTRGDPLPLPAGLDLCAYRIVQEALTNVRKHARATRATVAVSYDETELTVEVRDDGVGAASPPVPGHGLVGMRERVTLYDGSLETGPARPGGFRVFARLPLPEAS
ncbi:MAG TPA: sensor histidine kinase, partial [Acidimicrobiales bacterium]